MTIRAVTASAAGIAVATLLVAMLVTGNSPMPATRADGRRRTDPGRGEVRRVRGPTDRRIPRSGAPCAILDNGCAYNQRGIPSCGTLLGAAYGSNSDPVDWERQMGHRLGVHRTYFDGSEVDEAVAQARADLAHQRIPWISFKLPHSWGAMAAGEGDAWALDLSRQLARLPGPVWVAFHHEPEGDGNVEDWTAMQTRLGADRARGRTQRRLLGHPQRLEPALRRAPVPPGLVVARHDDRPGRLRRLQQVRRGQERPQDHHAHAVRGSTTSPGSSTSRGRTASPGVWPRRVRPTSRPGGPVLHPAPLRLGERARRRGDVLLQQHREQHRAVAPGGRQGRRLRGHAARDTRRSEARAFSC